MTMENQLVQTINEAGVEESTAITLQNSFMPFFQKANEWKEKASQLVVTDVSQTREMKMAREARLALREIRIDADKTRKALKEDSLRYGKAVQGVYNVIEYLIVPIEKHLEEQEKFAEIQEAKRITGLEEERGKEIAPFIEFVPYGVSLGNMEHEDYLKLLNGAKLQYQAKINAEQKAEMDRIAREKKEALERERIRLENIKLKEEAEARERKMQDERKKQELERRVIEEKARKEKEKADQLLRAEREKRERFEAEIRAEKEEADRKKKAEEIAMYKAEKQARLAPDKQKLTDLADRIRDIELPELKTEEGKLIIRDVKSYLDKIASFVIEKSNEL